ALGDMTQEQVLPSPAHGGDVGEADIRAAQRLGVGDISSGGQPTVIVGEGAYRYEVMADWEQLPAGWEHADVPGLATDSQTGVYVFNRSEHPVIVYDQDGRFLDTLGDATTYPRPHGITIVEDIIYLVDDGDHTVRKTTLYGTILMTLGTSGQPSDTGYRA